MQRLLSVALSVLWYHTLVGLQRCFKLNTRLKAKVFFFFFFTRFRQNTSPGLAGPVGSSYEDYSVTKDTEEKLIEVW